MTNEGGWICEPGDAERESWMSDAPWFKANERNCHRFQVRHRSGVSDCVDVMAWVTRRDLDRQLFYGNPIVTPGEMTGLSVRFDTLDCAQAQSAACVIDAGGLGPDLTSGWVIVWGPRSIYMVTPDGLPPAAGISEIALVVADWRYAVRVANIAPDADVQGLLDRAIVRLPAYLEDPEKFRPTIYLHPRFSSRLPRNHHRGIFVRTVDELRLNEARVVPASVEAA